MYRYSYWFRTNIHYLRKSRKLTLKYVSEQSGIPISTIGAIEKGNKIPKLETAVNLCNAYGVSFYDMISKNPRFVNSSNKVNDFRTIIVNQRKLINKSIYEVSDECGVSAKTISALERGFRDYNKCIIDIVCTLAQYYGVIENIISDN